MIITELITIDGVSFNRSYSDKGVFILQQGSGTLYEEAIDPANISRVYEETSIPIINEEPTIEEKAAAYDILMGGIEDDNT